MNIFRYVKERDPVWFTLLYLVVLISFICAVIYEPYLRKNAPGYFKSIAWFLALGPIALTVVHARNYRTTISSMPRLVSLYLQVVIMFGCIHFVSVASHMVPQITKTVKLLSNESAIQEFQEFQKNQKNQKNQYTQNIKGISGMWLVELYRDTSSKSSIINQALTSLYDSMHFSLMTSTTVGYGDMYPKTIWAKLMVDVQVLVSFFLIAFGVGSFFAQKETS